MIAYGSAVTLYDDVAYRRNTGWVVYTLWMMGSCLQWYIVLCSEQMGLFILNYTLNNGPIFLIIYSVLLGAHGPIHTVFCSERWAHPHACTLRTNGPILSIIYFVTLKAHGPKIMNLHSKLTCPSTKIWHCITLKWKTSILEDWQRAHMPKIAGHRPLDQLSSQLANILHIQHTNYNWQKL
jgi:hypothetical protein